MIVQITQTIKINNKWFYTDQQYLLVETITMENPYCQDMCNRYNYQGVDYYSLSGPYHRVTVDNLDYYIPNPCCAILPGDTPSTNMDPHSKRMIDHYVIDPVASLTGGRTDVVKQAKMIYGIDISQNNINNIDVDMVRYNELIQRMEQDGFVSNEIIDKSDVGISKNG
jgi:hypothetical protein